MPSPQLLCDATGLALVCSTASVALDIETVASSLDKAVTLLLFIDQRSICHMTCQRQYRNSDWNLNNCVLQPLRCPRPFPLHAVHISIIVTIICLLQCSQLVWEIWLEIGPIAITLWKSIKVNLKLFRGRYNELTLHLFLEGFFCIHVNFWQLSQYSFLLFWIGHVDEGLYWRAFNPTSTPGNWINALNTCQIECFSVQWK